KIQTKFGRAPARVEQWIIRPPASGQNTAQRTARAQPGPARDLNRLRVEQARHSLAAVLEQKGYTVHGAPSCSRSIRRRCSWARAHSRHWSRNSAGSCGWLCDNSGQCPAWWRTADVAVVAVSAPCSGRDEAGGLCQVGLLERPKAEGRSFRCCDA